MKKIVTMCLVTMLVFASVVPMNLQATSGGITCHEEFLMWLDGRSKLADDIQEATLLRVNSEANKANVKGMRENLAQLFEQYKAESARLDEATYSISIPGIIQSVERDMEQFQTTCQSIVDAETSSETELNEARREALNMLLCIEGSATHEKTMEKYQQLYSVYSDKISQTATIPELEEICNELDTKLLEMGLWDALLGLIIDEIDTEAYSAANQILVKQLMGEYSEKVVAYDGEELMLDFDGVSVQLVTEFQEKLADIQTLTQEPEHQYENIVKEEYLKSEATCVAKAVYYKSCSVCGVQDTNTFEYGVVNEDNHKNTELRGAEPATEEKEGYTGDTWCLDCNRQIATGTDIKKLEHKVEKVKANDATCTKEGNIEYYACESCGKVYEDEEGKVEIDVKDTVIEKIAHDTELQNVQAATADKKGYTGDKVCKVCKQVIERGKDIPATGEESPKTGDSNNAIHWVSFMLMAVAVAVIAYGYKKEEVR